jgi:hypothetical protein
MRQTSAVLAIALLFTLASCSDAVVEPALHEVADAEQMYASKSKGKVLTFTAPLSGRQEVPSNDSRATGNAVFQLSKDGTELSYKLIVANIQNVTMAHIHLAPAGANGPVVLWLYPSSPPAQLIAGRSQGILAEGTVTAGESCRAARRPSSERLGRPPPERRRLRERAYESVPSGRDQGSDQVGVLLLLHLERRKGRPI